MKARPISANCDAAFKTRNHACFGMSPFNSYFSEDRIREIAEWGLEEFESIHFFLPDGPSAYTLEALGYEPEKAVWKARRQGQYLENKIRRALSSLGIDDMRASEMILNWNVLTENPRYLALYEKTVELFETDSRFQDFCIDASNWVIENKIMDPSKLTRDVLRSAARYFLTELPLFVDTVGILEQPNSVFCYHQQVPFMEQLYGGLPYYPVSTNQGFVVLEPPSDARAAIEEHVQAVLQPSNGISGHP